MPDQFSFEYAVIRVVPHVERQEFVNVGLLLFCKTRDYLEANIDFKLARLKLLAPDSDEVMIKHQLKHIVDICLGSPNTGYFVQLSKSERFNWLTAPRSTVIQMSPVHSGICEDPRKAHEHLTALLVQ